MEERIKELLNFYKEKRDYHSNKYDEYIKKYGNDKSDYIIHCQNQYNLFLGAIQALGRLLP